MSEKTSNKAWRASVLTLFPDAFPGVLGASIIGGAEKSGIWQLETCLLYTSPSPRDKRQSRMPSSA